MILFYGRMIAPHFTTRRYGYGKLYGRCRKVAWR